MLAMDQLRKGLTVAEARASIVFVLASAGFTPATWKQGGIGLAILAALATLYSAITLALAGAIASGFLDTAEGAWLTYKAKSDYDVTRFPSFFATGKVTLTNTGGGLFIIEPGDLTFAHATSKKTYRNTSGGTLFPEGTPLTGPLDLDIIADEIGTGSNADPDTITILVTSILGVTCSNIGALYGQDEEDDVSLRERCRLSLGRLSPNGPKIAYEYFAKSALRADGGAIGVTRVRFPPPPGDGSFQLFLATKGGAVGGDVNDDSTDLGIIVRDIRANVLPYAVGPAVIASATEVPLAVTAHVYVRAAAGISTGGAQDLAAAGLRAFFPKVPIAGWRIEGANVLPKEALRAAVQSGSLHFVDATISSPASDTILAGDEVPIFAAPTIVVTQVADA